MKELSEYVERILWFIYRVLFTLIPAMFLLIVLFLFVVSTNLELEEWLLVSIKKIELNIWISIFAIVYMLNVLLEALTSFMLYLLDFRNLASSVYESDESFKSLMEKYNPEVFNIIKIDSGKIQLKRGLFNFGLIKGDRSVWFNNYVWFLISREFLFSNSALVLISINLFLLPVFLYKVYKLNFICFLGLQIIESVIVILLVRLTKFFLRNHYGNEYSDTSNKFNSIYVFVLVAASTIALILVNLSSGIYISIGVFLLTNIILCIMVPILYLRTCREYVNVEYLVMVNYLNRNYNKSDNPNA